MRKRELDFSISDLVYLKFPPMKEVKRFGKKGKLSPRYVGPYNIIGHFGSVTYELKLSAFLH